MARRILLAEASKPVAIRRDLEGTGFTLDAVPPALQLFPEGFDASAGLAPPSPRP
jgi:hypothetical protein